MGYLILDHDSLRKCIDNTVRSLRKRSREFDTIVFTGISGSLVAPIVATRLKKRLVAVRKSIRTCHAINTVEGSFGKRGYVVVDDFIISGATLRRIVREVEKRYSDAPWIPVCKGIYVYHKGCNNEFEAVMVAGEPIPVLSRR